MKADVLDTWTKMYGIIQNLFKKEYYVDDKVLIESPFEERTRNGHYLNTVLLAITPNTFVFPSEEKGEYKRKRFKQNDLKNKKFVIRSFYPLNSISLTIFKQTQRQLLKVAFNTTNTRYFELGRMKTRKIFWKLWCRHVNEIRSGSLIWPYATNKSSLLCQSCNPLRWTDKYLYLGSKRHTEDQIQPIPIPGLGRTVDIKLLYLRPEHIGCCEQTEQCDIERETSAHDYQVYTYNEVPTSNITYNSLITTVGIIGQF